MTLLQIKNILWDEQMMITAWIIESVAEGQHWNWKDR